MNIFRRSRNTWSKGCTYHTCYSLYHVPGIFLGHGLCHICHIYGLDHGLEGNVSGICKHGLLLVSSPLLGAVLFYASYTQSWPLLHLSCVLDLLTGDIFGLFSDVLPNIGVFLGMKETFFLMVFDLSRHVLAPAE